MRQALPPISKCKQHDDGLNTLSRQLEEAPSLASDLAHRASQSSRHGGCPVKRQGHHRRSVGVSSRQVSGSSPDISSPAVRDTDQTDLTDVSEVEERYSVDHFYALFNTFK